LLQNKDPVNEKIKDVRVKGAARGIIFWAALWSDQIHREVIRGFSQCSFYRHATGYSNTVSAALKIIPLAAP
jgi:hypothetical protein